METMRQKWNYDYAKTLWMKMYLAEPDFPNNRSKVFITFEQALDIIKAVDYITQGVQKIVYLVGWQGLGHDDCYPEMDVVNEALKRDCDDNARQSLETARVQVLQARDNLELVTHQFRLGDASRVDFTDAVGDLVEALGAKVKAFYAAQIAEARLVSLIGIADKSHERADENEE